MITSCRLRVLGGLFVVLSALARPAAAEDGPLSLRACYERALAHNESVGIAAAAWRAAEARYGQVRDTLLPAVSVVGGAQFQNDRTDSGAGGTSASRAPDSYVARLHAEQTLYSGFRLAREAQAREAEGRAAKLDEQRVREFLYLDVADAFYQVLLFDRDAAVLDELAAALDQTVAELEKRVELGRSRRADLLLARAERAENRVEQETVRGRQAATRELLGFVTDLPASSLVLAEDSPFPADPEIDEKLEHVTQRSDVLAGEARAEAAAREVEAARGGRQPQVRAEGNLYAYEDPDEDREWNILLALELPLFDEGVIRSRVRERAEASRISELNLAALRRQAASEVRSAYIAFMAAAGQRARLREALEVATENYEVQKRDYELGRASQLDALNALAQVQRLQRREVAAEMQARASLVRLHVAAGEGTP